MICFSVAGCLLALSNSATNSPFGDSKIKSGGLPVGLAVAEGTLVSVDVRVTEAEDSTVNVGLLLTSGVATGEVQAAKRTIRNESRNVLFN